LFVNKSRALEIIEGFDLSTANKRQTMSITIEELTSVEAQKTLKLASLTGYLAHQAVKEFFHITIQGDAVALPDLIERVTREHFDKVFADIQSAFNDEVSPIDFDEFKARQEAGILHQGIIRENFTAMGLWPVVWK
jgi:hypothetical protein